jgi:hypothetical protein
MPKIYHNNSGGNLKTIKTKLKKVFQDNDIKKKLKYNGSDIDSILKYIKKKLKNDKLNINEPHLNKKDFKEILNVIFDKMSKKQIDKLLTNINKLIQRDTTLMSGAGITDFSYGYIKYPFKFFIEAKGIIKYDSNIAYKLLYAHLYKYINTDFDNENHQVLNSDKNNYFNFKKNDSLVTNIGNIKLKIFDSEKNIKYNLYYVYKEKFYIYKGSEYVSAYDEDFAPTTNKVYILKTPENVSFKTYLILLTNDNTIVNQNNENNKIFPIETQSLYYNHEKSSDYIESSTYIYKYINFYLKKYTLDYILRIDKKKGKKSQNFFYLCAEIKKIYPMLQNNNIDSESKRLYILKTNGISIILPLNISVSDTKVPAAAPGASASAPAAKPAPAPASAPASAAKPAPPAAAAPGASASASAPAAKPAATASAASSSSSAANKTSQISKIAKYMLHYYIQVGIIIATRKNIKTSINIIKYNLYNQKGGATKDTEIKKSKTILRNMFYRYIR